MSFVLLESIDLILAQLFALGQHNVHAYYYAVTHDGDLLMFNIILDLKSTIINPNKLQI